MLIRLEADADVAAVTGALKAMGQWFAALSDSEGRVRALRIDPPSAPIDAGLLRDIPGVAEVLTTASPHPRVDAQARRPITVGRAVFGGADPVLIAGPCSVDSPETVRAAAEAAADAGARVLRGGAFKPRTSPYSFDGHGAEALGWMREAADTHGLAVVTEVLSEHDAGLVAGAADLLQIGSRNMQNFALLKAAGATGKPCLLKRGMAATVEEWLLAGEHLLAAGAEAVIFCERGVRGFDPALRNLLDLGAVALLAHGLGQPVIADPSHATGRRDLIEPLALAARAAGACGVMVEMHPDPARARSDAAQAIDRETLRRIGAGLGLTPAEEASR